MKGKLYLKSVFSRPIAFHPILARITKSVSAGLMLSQAIYWTDTMDEDREGWFHKTIEEWERETCLSRREQESARERLRSLGLVAEERRGLSPIKWFRVNFDVLQMLIDKEVSTNLSTEISSDGGKRHHVMAESAISRSTKAPSLMAESAISIKEAETTTETTQRVHTEIGLSSSPIEPGPAKQKAHADRTEPQKPNQTAGLPPTQRDSWDFRRWKEEMDVRHDGRRNGKDAWIEDARLSAFHVGITVERLQELLRQTRLFEEDLIGQLDTSDGLKLFAEAR
jgi:hypothetical protein